MKKIAIFASGSGTNAENLVKYFKERDAEISLIVTNNPNAGVLERAARLGVATAIFPREEWQTGEKVLHRLQSDGICFVVLAGFLYKVPACVTRAYARRMVNIHPALLPKFGGKGMYGDHVHRAVLAAGEHQSGITIHFVNDQYDDGDIIFQSTCEVLPSDTPESLATRIHNLEYLHFPRIVAQLVDTLEE